MCRQRAAGHSALDPDEATILYDGRELAGARTTCPHPGGCAELELAVTTPTTAGHNTASLRMLRQSEDAMDYVAMGTVLVSREDLSLKGVVIDLSSTHATLRAGDSVTFDLHFRDRTAPLDDVDPLNSDA